MSKKQSHSLQLASCTYNLTPRKAVQLYTLLQVYKTGYHAGLYYIRFSIDLASSYFYSCILKRFWRMATVADKL